MGWDACVIAMVLHTALAIPGPWAAWEGGKAALARVKVELTARGREAHSCMNLREVGL